MEGDLLQEEKPNGKEDIGLYGEPLQLLENPIKLLGRAEHQRAAGREEAHTVRDASQRLLVVNTCKIKLHERDYKTKKKSHI